MVNEYGKDLLYKSIAMLKKEHYDLFIMRHDNTLEKLNPFPVSTGKTPQYYNEEYIIIKLQIRTNLEKLRNDSLKKVIASFEMIDNPSDTMKDEYKNLMDIVAKKINSLIKEKKYKMALNLLKYLNSNSLYYKDTMKMLQEKLKIQQLEIEESEEILNSLTLENNSPKEEKIEESIEELQKEIETLELKKKKREKRQKEYTEVKNDLENIKAINTEIKSKIINKFEGVISKEELEKFIDSLDSNDLFYLESQTMLYIATLYNKEPNSKKALEILEFLEQNYGQELRLRFTNNENGNCLISNSLVSRAIEDAITNYDGNKTFIVALNISLRKLNRK